MKVKFGILFLFFGVSCCLFDDDENKPLHICGTVYDSYSRRPLEGTVVTVYGKSYTTDSSGKYEWLFYNINSESEYSITFEKDGHKKIDTLLQNKRQCTSNEDCCYEIFMGYPELM